MRDLRNVAIIAHVDHGKTTLVDQLLRQCDFFRENQQIQDRFLDSNDLERERGITILSKNVSITYKKTKINLIDTPGHADFGGEVERVLKMADGVLLLVDALEGPMPQTRFVLQKALQLQLTPLVVINKMDRPDSRAEDVLDEIYDLFIELGADIEMLEFPVLYTSAKAGWASGSRNAPGENMLPLLDAIRSELPAPEKTEGPLQMQISSLDYSDYVGRIGIGRVYRGRLKENGKFTVIKQDGTTIQQRPSQVFVFDGLERREVDEVHCGEICAVVGIDDIDIGDTVTDADHPEALPGIAIDEPTMSMLFTVNTSPFSGREGQYVTSRQIRARLFKELEHNVALRVEETDSPDTLKVSGRGLLHLSILLENMRREGYEVMVGQPQVIYKEIDGQTSEPIETLVVDVPSDYSGQIIEMVGQRRGEMKRMEPRGDMHHLEFHIPSRGLMGLRNRVLTASSGEAIMHHRFYEYEKYRGEISHRKTGALISMGQGRVTAYALDALQDRGRFFVEPGEMVYQGQIVGENNRPDDLDVNMQKEKKLTNVRAAGSDRELQFPPATRLSLEESLEFVREHELVEVTPESVRLRKKLLNPSERKRHRRSGS